MFSWQFLDTIKENTIYTKYKQLTKKQRQQLLAALQSQGINIVKIEAYEYTDAPSIVSIRYYLTLPMSI
jgi:hypothetical protein